MRRKQFVTTVLCSAMTLAAASVGSAATVYIPQGSRVVLAAEDDAQAASEDEEAKARAAEEAAEKAAAEEAAKKAAEEQAAKEAAEKAAAEEAAKKAAEEQAAKEAAEKAAAEEAAKKAAEEQAAKEAAEKAAAEEAAKKAAEEQAAKEAAEKAAAEEAAKKAAEEQAAKEAAEKATEQTITEAPTETPIETETQAPTERETEVQTETEAEAETEPLTEEATEQDTEDTTDEESETEESETEESEETESETEEDTEEEELEGKSLSPYSTNAELLAHQNIVTPPDIQLEFRFTQIEEQRFAIVSNKAGAAIRESESDEARKVGTLDYYGYAYILDDSGDGWYYVESGDSRGFIRAEDVVTDEVAQRIVTVRGLDALPAAQVLVSAAENEAFDYTHTTVQEVLAEKVYAIASGEVKIREAGKASARTVGTLSDGALCYILADAEKDWIYVESGDARGFVRKEQLITGSEAEQTVSDRGENNMSLASVEIEPEDNAACYYTLTSVKEASQESRTREAIVNFALQFVGNPYVWGGTSLTNGADCSGFVQSIYAYFGYYLPRVADEQSVYGMQIPISSAQPGDLIFYASEGYVYHVSMYIGNGQVVQAANSRAGIITSGISGNAVWATRIIQG